MFVELNKNSIFALDFPQRVNKWSRRRSPPRDLTCLKDFKTDVRNRRELTDSSSRLKKERSCSFITFRTQKAVLLWSLTRCC